jgi:hypothetical protein
MFNRGVPAFYNHKLDTQTKEERFLLKRRIRLMNKLDALDKTAKHYFQAHRKLSRQLRETEAKLGIKP